MANIRLVKFQELAKQAAGTDYTKPPFRVPSKSLDENFAKLTPAEQSGSTRPYTIDSTEEGFFIVPQIEFFVCVNGEAKEYRFLAQEVN